MSRAKNYWDLLRAPLVVLPFVIACGSSPKPPAESPADKTEEADTKSELNKDDADSGEASKKDDSKKDDSDKAASDDKKSSDKNADADDDDDAPPKDDSRTTAAVAKIFKDNRKAFKKCYEDVRKEKPELKGNVLLKVNLDGEGQVKKAWVDDESSIRDQKVVDCMIKLAKTLTYPKSSKGLDKEFEYDFGFNNQTK